MASVVSGPRVCTRCFQVSQFRKDHLRYLGRFSGTGVKTGLNHCTDCTIVGAGMRAVSGPLPKSCQIRDMLGELGNVRISFFEHFRMTLGGLAVASLQTAL